MSGTWVPPCFSSSHRLPACPISLPHPPRSFSLNSQGAERMATGALTSERGDAAETEDPASRFQV